MQRRIVILVVMTAAWHGIAGAAVSASQEMPTTPVVFDGLGLEDFKGSGSIASALRGIESDSKPADLPLGVPVDVVVRGPSGRGSGGDPLAAEMTSRLQGIDLTAGMQADPAAIQEGPAKWLGCVGVSSDHDRGREVLELKTSLGRSRQAGILGVEVGPRIERRLRGGTVFFLDGKAQAQARRSAETGGWMMPSLADQGATGTVGLAASTGLVR